MQGVQGTGTRSSRSGAFHALVSGRAQPTRSALFPPSAFAHRRTRCGPRLGRTSPRSPPARRARENPRRPPRPKARLTSAPALASASSRAVRPLLGNGTPRVGARRASLESGILGARRSLASSPGFSRRRRAARRARNRLVSLVVSSAGARADRLPSRLPLVPFSTVSARTPRTVTRPRTTAAR